MELQRIKALVADYLFKTIGYVPDDRMWENLWFDVDNCLKDFASKEVVQAFERDERLMHPQDLDAKHNLEEERWLREQATSE